jgi:signal transduction histidine kinase
MTDSLIGQYRVTQQHGGVIEVDSRVGEFTEFTIRLSRLLTDAIGRP